MSRKIEPLGPTGADGAPGLKLIEEINDDEGVSWLFSFLSADRHRSYCLYEAPNPDAIIDRLRLSASERRRHCVTRELARRDCRPATQLESPRSTARLAQ